LYAVAVFEVVVGVGVLPPVEGDGRHALVGEIPLAFERGDGPAPRAVVANLGHGGSLAWRLLSTVA